MCNEEVHDGGLIYLKPEEIDSYIKQKARVIGGGGKGMDYFKKFFEDQSFVMENYEEDRFNITVVHLKCFKNE